MEKKWLMDNRKNENDDDSDLVSIPMVQIHGSGHHRASRQSHERSSRNSAGYSPLQDDEVFFPIDESAWSPEPRPLSTLNSVTADRHDNVDYFHVDENAWTMSGAYSETQEPVEAVTGQDGKVLFSLRRHKSMSPRPKRPRSLNLRSASEAHPPASLSTQSSQMSLESNVNFGFQDFDDGSSLVNHRLVKFEHDTAMLFRSLSRPQQKSKKPWHRLISVWWNSFLGLCCSCCSCRRGCRRWTCSCRDEKGVHFLQMAKKKILSHLLLVQVVISILTVILSAMVFFPLGLNFRSFNDQCLLYANVKLIPKTEEAVGVKIDLTTTLFGDVEECNYTTYLNVVVAIASVIFLWFFYHTRSLDTSEHSEVKLQLPVLLVHLGMLVCVMVSSCKITIGFNQWCANLAYTDPTKNFKHCKDYENLSWDVTTRAYECPFYTFNLLAEASSWLLAFALFLQCIVTSVRLYQDFVTTFQEAEVPHKKLDEVDDTDSLCLELGLTNQGSDEFIDTGAHIVEVEKYNPEAKRIQLAEAIIHQNILAMASGDQLPSKKNPAQPIVLDTESFKKKSKAKKAGVTDFVDSGVETATESLKKKKMIELQPMVPHVLVSVPDASGSINSEGEDFDTTEGDESHRLNQEQKTMDYMNSRKCPDGQW